MLNVLSEMKKRGVDGSINDIQQGYLRCLSNATFYHKESYILSQSVVYLIWAK